MKPLVFVLRHRTGRGDWKPAGEFATLAAAVRAISAGGDWHAAAGEVSGKVSGG